MASPKSMLNMTMSHNYQRQETAKLKLGLSVLPSRLCYNWYKVLQEQKSLKKDPAASDANDDTRFQNSKTLRRILNATHECVRVNTTMHLNETP